MSVFLVEGLHGSRVVYQRNHHIAVTNGFGTFYHNGITTHNSGIDHALALDLQDKGISAVYDINLRSLKAQLKYADKLGAKYSLVIGDDEADQMKGKLKNMHDGTEVTVDLDPERLAAAL